MNHDELDVPIPRQWSNICVYTVINIRSHWQLLKSTSEKVTVGFLSIRRNRLTQESHFLWSVVHRYRSESWISMNGYICLPFLGCTMSCIVSNSTLSNISSITVGLLSLSSLFEAFSNNFAKWPSPQGKQRFVYCCKYFSAWLCSSIFWFSVSNLNHGWDIRIQLVIVERLLPTDKSCRETLSFWISSDRRKRTSADPAAPLLNIHDALTRNTKFNDPYIHGIVRPIQLQKIPVSEVGFRLFWINIIGPE